MARGWESKAVESQLEEKARTTRPETKSAPLTVAERALHVRRRTLELIRARLLADLEAASIPAHRTMLETALADVERQIADLDSTAT